MHDKEIYIHRAPKLAYVQMQQHIENLMKIYLRLVST